MARLWGSNGAWFALGTEEETQEPERLPEALVFWTCQVVNQMEVYQKPTYLEKSIQNHLVLQVDIGIQWYLY